ncbi:MAG: COX15/CtaA family protein [Sphingomonas sp.]|nr:COX15/CtaA family protein [Sphingomonas sp.]
MDSSLTARPAASAAIPKPMALSNLLFAIAAMVFVMVVVGGITRLTESGLSITEWRPLSGAIPPLTPADWTRAFELYQQTTEYREVNGPAGMTLAQFKQIYWWEFIHRLLGRLIGLAFAVPLLWFAIRREIPRGYGWKMVALFVLGGLQGVLGWYMVMSGLAERTDVSHLRLSAHLMLALFIMGALIWVALDLRRLASTGADRPSRLTGPTAAVLGALALQVLLGAWVAGMNAGQVADSWPLMNERFFPAGVDWSLGIAAFANDPFLVHFLHRWWAWGLVVMLVLFARKVRAAGSRAASVAIHCAFGAQILLGIFTVTSGVALPLAAMHQAVGAILVGATVWGAHVAGGRDDGRIGRQVV